MFDKLSKSLFRVFLFSLVFMILVPSVGAGAEFQGGTSITIGDSTDGSLFVAGRNLIINAPVRGDLYCAGQEVLVNADVSGDILCAAQDIELEGSVGGDVRSVGYSVLIKNTVENSVSVIAENLTFPDRSRTGGDILVTANKVNLSGEVGRDFIALGQTIDLSSTVQGSAWLNVRRLTLNDEANIEGNLTYRSQSEYTDNGGSIRGSISFYRSEDSSGEDSDTTKERSSENSWIGFSFWSYLYFTVSFLLVGYVLALFESRTLDQVLSDYLNYPGPVFGWGLVICFVPPPLVFILCLIVFGVPLAILFSFAWMLILGVSVIVTGVATGRFILEKLSPEHAQTLWAVTIGIPFFGLVTYAPWIGWLFVLMAIIGGSGAVFRTIFIQRQ